MTSTAAAPSVRDQLRTATDVLHQALHHAAPFAAIAAATLDRKGYGDVLGFLYRYHQGLAGLCAAGANFLKVPELAEAHAARIVALEQDLDFLGMKPIATSTTPGPDGAFAAGCLYTVQGSTLGGKVIYRQLDYLLPDEQGRRFFKGGPEDGAPWRKLCAALESQTPTAQLEQGALFAFTRFRDLLEAM